MVPTHPDPGLRVCGGTAVQQVGRFLVPDPEDFQKHANAIGDDALLLLTAALAVGPEMGLAVLAELTREIRRAASAAVAEAWEAACLAQAEHEAETSGKAA